MTFRETGYSNIRMPGQLWMIWDNLRQAWASGQPSVNVTRLRRRADRLDMEYGAIRYSVRPVVLA